MDDTRRRAFLTAAGTIGLIPAAGAQFGRALGFSATGAGAAQELGGENRASTIGWLSSRTGAVLRSLGDWLEDAHSIMDYLPLAERVKVRLGTSRADLSAYLQRAMDNLPDGGTVEMPKGLYHINFTDVNHRRIKVRLAAGTTIRKFGAGALETRGIFRIRNLLDAHFTLEGAGKGLSVIDLNDEGPAAIGALGRNANRYGVQNGGVKGIAPTGNAAIYALRSTHISARGLSVENTSESCFLFRNCADTLVADSFMRNAGQFGVEWSLTPAAHDSGTGAMPDRSRQYVIGCDFADMPDFALGGGNGVAVGGGGSPGEEVFRDYQVLDCTMLRCQRDVHVEFNGGGHVDGMMIRIQSRDAWQGSVGLVHVRNYDVKVNAINPGSGPCGALSALLHSYADVYGVVISGSSSGNGVVDAQIIDQRNSKSFIGADAAMRAGSSVLTSASAAFTKTSRAGDPFGVLGAGSGGVCLLATVISVDSDTQVTLTAAAGSTVSAARYAHGGATRHGIIVNGGGDIEIRGRIEAGIFSGLAGEPEAAGLHISSAVSGRVETSGLTIVAPPTRGTTPTGVRLGGTLVGAGKFRAGSIRVRGFGTAFVGIDSFRAACLGPTTVTPNGLTAKPAAKINSDGAEEFIVPHGDRFAHILGGMLIFALAGETVVVTVSAYRFDGSSNTVEIESNTNGQTVALSEFHLWQLNQDNAPLQKIGVKARSSIAGSGATVNYYFRGLEG